MSGGMPELGSKISLISKADIRYEGRLYTVDPQECTIALSSVRSFGTEDRETQFQIAPQSQIYDYILFRGSDIKDIRVVNNSIPHPNDPAIMQVQLPNGQHLMPHFPMPSMNPHPTAPPMGAGAYGNPFGGMGGLGGMTAAGTAASALAPGAGTGGAPVAPAAFMLNNHQQHQNKQQQQQQQKQPTQVDSNSISNQLTQALSVGNGGTGVGGGSSVVGLGSANTVSNNLLSHVNLANAALIEHNKEQDLIAGASRSTTPISLISRKSPSADMGVQVNQQQQQQHPHPLHNQQQQQQHHQNGNNQHHHHQNQNNQNNAGHGGGGGGGGNSRDAGQKRQNHHQAPHQPYQRIGNHSNNQRNNANNDYYQPRDRRDSSGRNMESYSNQHHDNRGGNNNYNNQRNNQPGQNRAWTMHRSQNSGGGGGGGGGNNMMRNRGGGGRGRMPNQGYRPIGGGPGGNQNKLRNPKNTIKFEQDFDFEQANNQFEELRSQLTKLKVGDEPKTTEQINGDTADKKDDSGNETGAGEHEPEDEEITVGYDKTKSFFDNISCEAAQDRVKNKKNDWRQERKLNSETFGVSSTRRGGYRGRGSYYNRNMGYNSGYNRGYRGGSSYNRNRNNNHRMGGGGGGSGGNTHSHSNTNNIVTNGGGPSVGSNDATVQKNQQSMSATSSGNAAGTAVSTTTATTAAVTTPNIKTSTTTQENNTQPQVAAVGVGQ